MGEQPHESTQHHYDITAIFFPHWMQISLHCVQWKSHHQMSLWKCLKGRKERFQWNYSSEFFSAVLVARSRRKVTRWGHQQETYSSVTFLATCTIYIQHAHVCTLHKLPENLSTTCQGKSDRVWTKYTTHNVWPTMRKPTICNKSLIYSRGPRTEKQFLVVMRRKFSFFSTWWYAMFIYLWHPNYSYGALLVDLRNIHKMPVFWKSCYTTRVYINACNSACDQDLLSWNFHQCTQ